MATLLAANSIIRLNLKTSILKGVKIRKFHHQTSKFAGLKSCSKYVLSGSILVGGGLLCVKLGADYDLKLSVNKLIDSILGRFVVDCENLTGKRNRTAHYEETVAGSELLANKSDSFDWAEFFRLIYQEKWYFLAATIVSC